MVIRQDFSPVHRSKSELDDAPAVHNLQIFDFKGVRASGTTFKPDIIKGIWLAIVFDQPLSALNVFL